MADPHRIWSWVRWYNRKLGWGFIIAPPFVRKQHNKDIFVVCSDIMGEGFQYLDPGEKVTFDLEITNKGPRARRVVSQDRT